MRIVILLCLLPIFGFTQIKFDVLMQSDSLIGDDGEFINRTVSGFYFDSDTSCYQFYFSEINDEEYDFNPKQSLVKNIKNYLIDRRNTKFSDLTRLYFSVESSSVHQILRFEQVFSFNTYSIADLMIIDKSAVQVYTSQDECPHCYHSNGDDLYFFIYEPVKLGRRIKKKLTL